MFTYFLFVLGFFVLIKGADFLVDGSTSIAKKLKIPSIVIGLTIVSFGTSAPEFFVNIFASLKGNTEIAIGNILGSNICNIFLILGISAIIYPLTAQKNTVWKEIPFSLLAALVVGILANDYLIDGNVFYSLARIDGIILLFFFVIFLYYIVEITRSEKSEKDPVPVKELSHTFSALYILGGLACLIIGSDWIINGAILLAHKLNISQSLIGLTIVSIGTSLPELVTSAVAAYKKQNDIAIGNVIGSNVFNIFLILGISAVIRPLPFKSDFNMDIVMAIFASLIVFMAMFVGKKHTLERWQGVLLVLIYIGYLVFLIHRG